MLLEEMDWWRGTFSPDRTTAMQLYTCFGEIGTTLYITWNVLIPMALALYAATDANDNYS
jgi:hypothetical protein